MAAIDFSSIIMKDGKSVEALAIGPYRVGAYKHWLTFEKGDDIMYAVNIPQESVTIPETMDAVRAALGMQATREEGTSATNRYLKIGRHL